jgi:AbrB family looped-hinge helix DNA binding protein
MTSKVVLDKAGRVVLPKPVRDQMKLEAGDSFDLEAEGERITLRPVRAKAALKKELGVWVYQGEPSDLSIPDFLDKLRDERDVELQK